MAVAVAQNHWRLNSRPFVFDCFQGIRTLVNGHNVKTLSEASVSTHLIGNRVGQGEDQDGATQNEHVIHILMGAQEGRHDAEKRGRTAPLIKFIDGT